MSDVDRNKATIRRWLSQLDARNLDTYEELLAKGARSHFPGGVQLDRQATIDSEEAWYAAFPDTIHSIDDLFAEDDRVVLRETVRGTHIAEFQGIPGSSKPFEVTAIVIYRLQGGQIHEIWAEADLGSFVSRLAARD